jgi:hypothetical protein
MSSHLNEEPPEILSNLCNWIIHVHNFQNIKIFWYDFGLSRHLLLTRWKGRVSFESCMIYRSSHINTHNHSLVTAIKHETRCIKGSSSLLCKGYRKYSSRNVNLAAHTCVGLVPTCRMRELHSSSRVYGVVPRYRDNFTVRPTSRFLVLHFTQKWAEQGFIII